MLQRKHSPRRAKVRRILRRHSPHDIISVLAKQRGQRRTTQQTTAGVMVRVGLLNNPERAKQEEEVYQRVEAWRKELEELTLVEPDLGTHDRYKVNAVRKILVGKVAQVVEQRWKCLDFMHTIQDWSLKAHIENREKFDNVFVDTNERFLID